MYHSVVENEKNDKNVTAFAFVTTCDHGGPWMIPQVAYPHSVGIAPIASLSQERCRHATLRLRLAKPFRKQKWVRGGGSFQKWGSRSVPRHRERNWGSRSVQRHRERNPGGHGPSPRHRERTALGVSKIRYIYYLSMCRLEPHVRRGRSLYYCLFNLVLSSLHDDLLRRYNRRGRPFTAPICHCLPFD
jgi:hypothetical protein